MEFLLHTDCMWMAFFTVDGVFTCGNGDSLRFYMYHDDLFTLASDFLYIIMIPVDGVFSYGWHFYLQEW
jgi:hypothetical protein